MLFGESLDLVFGGGGFAGRFVGSNSSWGSVGVSKDDLEIVLAKTKQQQHQLLYFVLVHQDDIGLMFESASPVLLFRYNLVREAKNSQK